MPSYEFQTSEGTIIELFFHMREVPAIGATVNHDLFGAVTRIASAAQVSTNFTTGTYPYASNALPRNLPGCRTDSRGRPIIESRRHERNVASEHGYQRAED
jgi:hypothetical protein